MYRAWNRSRHSLIKKFNKTDLGTNKESWNTSRPPEWDKKMYKVAEFILRGQEEKCLQQKEKLFKDNN